MRPSVFALADARAPFPRSGWPPPADVIAPPRAMRTRGELWRRAISARFLSSPFRDPREPERRLSRSARGCIAMPRVSLGPVFSPFPAGSFRPERPYWPRRIGRRMQMPPLSWRLRFGIGRRAAADCVSESKLAIANMGEKFMIRRLSRKMWEPIVKPAGGSIYLGWHR